MHAEVADAAKRAAFLKRAQLYGATGLAATTAGAAALGVALAAPVLGPGPPLGVGLVGAAATAGLHYLNHNATEAALADLNGPGGLDGLYRLKFAEDVVRGDEESAALWVRVKDHLLNKLGALGGASAVPKPPLGATQTLRRVLDHDVPRLRRNAAPGSYSGFPRDKDHPPAP